MANSNWGNQHKKRQWQIAIGIAAVAVGSAAVVSCFHGDDDPAVVPGDGGGTALPEPAPLEVAGTSLYCDPATVTPVSTAAAGLFVDPLAVDSIPDINISKDASNHNSANNLKRLAAIVNGQTSAGVVATDPVTQDPIGDVHPLIVSFGEQVIGGYEGGDGSKGIDA